MRDLAVALMLLCAPHALANPVVGVVLQPVIGLDGKDAAQKSQALHTRLVNEVASTGATAQALSPLDDACAAQVSCRAQVLAALRQQGSPVTSLVVVEIIRAGPVSQVTTHLVADIQQSASASVDSNAALLPDAIRQAISDEVARARAAATTTTKAPPPPPANVDAKAPPPTTTAVTAPAAEEAAPLALSTLFGAGAVVGGVGALALLAGAITTATQEAVLADPKSSAEDKDSATVLGRMGLASLGLGALLVVAGGAVIAVDQLHLLPAE